MRKQGKMLWMVLVVLMSMVSAGGAWAASTPISNPPLVPSTISTAPKECAVVTTFTNARSCMLAVVSQDLLAVQIYLSKLVSTITQLVTNVNTLNQTVAGLTQEPIIYWVSSPESPMLKTQRPHNNMMTWVIFCDADILKKAKCLEGDEMLHEFEYIVRDKKLYRPGDLTCSVEDSTQDNTQAPENAIKFYDYFKTLLGDVNPADGFIKKVMCASTHFAKDGYQIVQ